MRSVIAVSGVSYGIDFNDVEVKTLIEILRYSLDYCPIEVASDVVRVTRERVENLLDKLEDSLRSIPSPEA